MRHFLLLLAVLVLALLAAWVSVLRQGPGDIAMYEPRPWPKALEALAAQPVGASLDGRIQRADRAPAAEALVQTTVATDDQGGRAVRWAWTDSLGRFHLDGLSSDQPLVLVVLAADHMPASFDVELGPGVPAEELVWSLPAPIDEVEVLPALEFGDLQGRVRRPLGERGTARLEVLLRPLEVGAPTPGDAQAMAFLAGRIERRATVDAAGGYTVPALAAGFYEVLVLPDWARGGTWPVLGRGSVDHAPGSTQPQFPVVLEDATVSGIVTDAGGQPVVGALLLASRDDRVWPPVQSGADGSYQLVDLDAGPLHVEVLAGSASASLDLTLGPGEGRELPVTLPPLD
ncbi:MAG: carboxypeptidase-like regulatory domain-containing protein [Planctomycetota bacterium]|nr:carboxypeptidase-like regulatory domain-containing protein [Planctomycetota bacterium]